MARPGIVYFYFKGVEKLKVLIFEFATAVGVEDPSITAEGRAMLSGLLSDFKGMKSDCSVDYLISNNSKLTDEDMDLNGNTQIKPIKLTEDLTEWLKGNIQTYDTCFLVAPEEDMILHGLTQLVEDNGVEVIGPTSEAVMMCTNKSRMQDLLENNESLKKHLINTEKVFFDGVDEVGKEYWAVTEGRSENPMVVKPADGVSCEGVQIVRNLNQFKEASMAIKSLTRLPYFLLQEYVEGVTASVSLLSDGKKAVPLSLNLQNVHTENGKIIYEGGCVPLEHELSKNAKEVAKEVVESINGLKGYVGVDMILGDDVYVVEVNSRLTTPYVALRKLLSFNVGEAIFGSVKGKLPSEVSINGKVKFRKMDNNDLNLEVIK